jgi:hypothetical protein
MNESVNSWRETHLASSVCRVHPRNAFGRWAMNSSQRPDRPASRQRPHQMPTQHYRRNLTGRWAINSSQRPDRPASRQRPHQMPTQHYRRNLTPRVSAPARRWRIEPLQKFNFCLPSCSIFDVKTTGHSNDQIYDQGLEKHVVWRILKRVFPAPLENPP